MIPVPDARAPGFVFLRDDYRGVIALNVRKVSIFHYFGKFSGISNFQMQLVENHFGAEAKK